MDPRRHSGGSAQASDPQGQVWPNMFGLLNQPAQQSLGQAHVGQSYTNGLNNVGNSAWTNDGQNAYSTLPPRSQTTHTSQQPNSGIEGDDPVLSFMQSMPTRNEDQSRHALWTELVRLKTRTIELQIAQARAKEKEAEAELAKLRQIYRQKGGTEDLSMATGQDVFGSLPMSVTGSAEFGQSGTGLDLYGQAGSSSNSNYGNQSNNFGNTNTVTPGRPIDPEHAMTTFDLEAMMQHNNLDNLFSWLPDFGETPPANRMQATSTGPIHGIDPNDLYNANNNQQNQNMGMSFVPMPDTPRSVKPNITSPIRRRSNTPDEDEPASKKAKRPEKKIVVEQISECVVCHKALAKIMVRAPKSAIPDQIRAEFTCPDCKPVPQPPSLTDVYGTGAGGHGIGTVDTRKRLRMAMEAEDEEKVESDSRRVFCDVCQRVFGSGTVVGGQGRENMAPISEFVCTGCESKYSRCTDCGGGGGGRVGIGKWRMKQVFQPGRKTCSLSHTRLGDRPREIGVHVTPTDFTAEELKEVLSRCKQLWNEKTLARLAVPEMLEIDLPSQMTNPIRNYADVEDIVTQNWPNRESMIRAEGADPGRFKRLLGLVWAHSKSRRGTRTVDIEEEWQKTTEGDADDMSTVLENVKRTNLAIPGGSELIGMWGGEWDMKHGALLVSTFIPFEGTDGEDSTALSVGEMITKVQTMRQSINQERREVAEKQGVEPDLVPQCEHLWVVSGGAMPLVRERIADILVRKRSFVHVDEYLTRHPDFANALSARPVGLHPDVLRPSPSTSESKPPPLILVRWLGKDFDAQKILEIKQAEFGGKSKLKKKTKAK